MQTTNIGFLLDTSYEELTGAGTSFASPVSSALHIGYHGSAPSSEFSGQMAELRIWKSRSVAQLRQYWRTEISAGEETDLVSYWSLIPHSSDLLPDLSPAANHIQTSGFTTTYQIEAAESGLQLCRGR